MISSEINTNIDKVVTDLRLTADTYKQLAEELPSLQKEASQLMILDDEHVVNFAKAFMGR